MSEIPNIGLPFEVILQVLTDESTPDADRVIKLALLSLGQKFLAVNELTISIEVVKERALVISGILAKLNKWIETLNFEPGLN